MVNRKISPDLKRAAMRLYGKQKISIQDAIDEMGVSRSTFFRVKRLWQHDRTVENQQRQNTARGRPRALVPDDIHYLIELILQRPDWYLDELLSLLEQHRFVSVHYSTIHRELHRAGLSYKKLKKLAQERNKDLWADYVRRMAEYSDFQLGFLDEVSKDEHNRSRLGGRAFRGQQARRKGVFVRGRRLSAEGLLTVDGMVACTVVEGSMTHDKFLAFLEHHVMPLTTPYPGPLSVLVMDNARIHHSAQIMELAGHFGVRVEYLPPYSPDMNPIEEAFSKIKSWIQRHADEMSDSHGILYDMYVAMDIITLQDAVSYIHHAGYL